METLNKFPCIQCGECCRHIDLIPQLSEFNRGDGVCIHLCGNLCDIYESRPDICRVDKMYDVFFSKEYSREEYYRLNLSVCQELQKKQ